MAIGSPALLRVDWGTRIIYIDKAYMSVVQLTPTEIRELNTLTLHQDLRDLEDDEEGMPHPDTHNFVGPVTVGGVTLAPVVEIINGYTIWFEENAPAGTPPCPVPYAINLQGTNNNVADVTIVNSVSVRSANSAGLTFSTQIENTAFADARVWINTISGITGTQYPIGTAARPVNNPADSVRIIASRNLPPRIHLLGEITVPTSNIDGLNLLGDSDLDAIIHFGVTDAGSPQTFFDYTDIAGNFYQHVTVNGFVTGTATFSSCTLGPLDGFNGEANDSNIIGPITLEAGDHRIIDCNSAIPGTVAPIIDFNNVPGITLSVRGYNGGIELRNVNDPATTVTIDLGSGHVKLHPSVLEGTYVIRGTGHLTDNSGPNTNVVTLGLVEGTAGAAGWGGM